MKNGLMQWDKERLTDLTLKYLQDGLSVEEQAELDQWLNADPINKERFEARISAEKLTEGMAIWQAARASKEKARARMNWAPAEATKVIPMRPRRWGALAVAVLLIILLGGAAIVVLRRDNVPTQPQQKLAADLPPGGNRATLTLANGSTVLLDSTGNGFIARQGHSTVVKRNGNLLYEKGDSIADPGFNMVSTPRGGQYEVSLPDGTKVWLNAESSIRYQTGFDGNRREIEMTGEAYFEVVHSAAQPFIVKVNGREIQDIGTHFDVDAYKDEPVLRTTVLEGAVRTAGLEVHAGQQLRIDSTGKPVLKTNINAEEVIAWKNGFFEFESADIGTVMRAIGRWYDVDVRYKVDKKSHRFTGQIRRNSNASEAIRILTTSGYHFEIIGNTITVLP